MNNYSFISEKQIGDDIYQAWRNDLEPSEVVVLLNGVSVNYQGPFEAFWRGL